MLKNKYLILSLIIALVFISCEDRNDLTAPSPPNTGSADFTNFVTIGNSLTAGMQSSALYESGQNYSFGKLIADQVGIDFVQPTISDPGMGGRIEASSLMPFVTTTQPLAAGLPNNLDYSGIYNNLGIPGALLPDILQATSAQNALDPSNLFFDVVLRGQGTALDQARALQPTIATLWIGNNDILGYATSGGTLAHTPTEIFAFLYDQLCGALALDGIPVILANIPYVTSIPFFTTVGQQLISQGVSIIYGTKSDGTVIPMDLSKVLLTLRAQAEISENKGFTESLPLSNSVILDEDEITVANNVTSSFNATIANVAVKYGFHLVNINSFFNDIANNGIEVDGILFTTEFVFGGLFSLDGVHPSSQGYAIVANEFIEVINEKFSAEIPLVNVASVPGSLELNKRVEFNKLGLPIFAEGTFDSIFY